MKTISKTLILFVLVILTFSVTSAQQSGKKSEKKFEFTWVAVDIFPVGDDTTQYSPDYGWKTGSRWSGGGFAEFGKNRPLFSRHNIRVKPAPKQVPFLQFRTEVAFNKTGALVQAGPQFELTQMPTVGKPLRKVLRGLSVTPMSKFIGNIGTRNETLVTWNTQKLKISQAVA